MSSSQHQQIILGICEVSNWKKNAQKIRAYIYKKKKEIDRSIDLFKALASNNERFNFDTGIVLLSNNNVDDDEELSDHRRVPPRVPLSSVCRSMAPEHVGCRDTRETPARGVGKERRRERERDLDVDSSATAKWTRLGDKKRTARRDAVSED